ncbi:hypothetical protein [Limnoraphis robusta]|uniref:Uncharacterized protein n=1 Tax=Limnoraphis robusta CCNP1315 TaxID=3110306 RepID=A0ABU5U310_9CYAN|nr:hypothetical protein [Limnoraphis robusta]MEA5521566.1 hypothetical protein [Limnoraphis robusta CCNP1315]MEA5545792.1 hypothetical protein [Limnoraphis robusta CCNP1324]
MAQNTKTRKPSVEKFSLWKTGVCLWTLCKTHLYPYKKATADEAGSLHHKRIALVIGTSPNWNIILNLVDR